MAQKRFYTAWVESGRGRYVRSRSETDVLTAVSSSWKMLIKRVLPHIQIGLNEDNRCIVVIDNYELFDFISNYLDDECDLPYDYQRRRHG